MNAPPTRESRPRPEGGNPENVPVVDSFTVAQGADEGHERREPFQVMPALSADELDALRADIAGRGVLVPVVVDQHGRTLDGHHRQQLAAELGIDCPTEVRQVADDEDARQVALALNLTRRHLTREQKRDLIAAEAELRPQDSDRAIARRLGCSPSTVAAVRARTSRVSKLDTEPLGPGEAVEIVARIDEGLGELDETLFSLHRINFEWPWSGVGLLLRCAKALAEVDSDEEFLDPTVRWLIRPRLVAVLESAGINGPTVADGLLSVSLPSRAAS